MSVRKRGSVQASRRPVCAPIRSCRAHRELDGRALHILGAQSGLHAVFDAPDPEPATHRERDTNGRGGYRGESRADASEVGLWVAYFGFVGRVRGVR